MSEIDIDSKKHRQKLYNQAHKLKKQWVIDNPDKSIKEWINPLKNKNTLTDDEKKQKLNEYRKKYQEKTKCNRVEYCKNYYKEHSEHIKNNTQVYYQNHKDKMNELNKNNIKKIREKAKLYDLSK